MEAIIEVFGIDWRLLLIQAFNFGLLLLILWWFLYRPLARIVGERQQVIEKGVKDAEKAQTRLSEVADEADGIRKEATLEGEKIVATATTEAKTREAKLMSEANAKAETTIEDAHLKAEEIKRKALADSEAEIARIAVLGAEKVLREKAG